MHDLLDELSDYDRCFQSFPEYAKRPLIEIIKLIIAPAAWIRFRTLRDKYKGDVQNEQLNAKGYKYIETIVDFGKKFIDERLARSDGKLSEAVRDDLLEWGKVQGDLSFMYAELVKTADRIVQAN